LKVFLHIGQHKAGSTTIQNFLSSNRDALLAKGYIYPGKKPHHHRLVNGFISMNKLRSAEESEGAWKATWHEIEKSGVSKVILSSESFERAETKEHFDWIKDCFKNVDLTVIVYMREQSSRLESTYVEQLKGGFWRSFDTYVENRQEFLNYDLKMAPWAEMFGHENIVVRPLEKEVSKNLRADFLRCCGITDLDGFEITPDQRTRTSLINLKLVYRMNRDLRGGNWEKRGMTNFIKQSRLLKNILDEYDEKHGDNSKYRFMSYDQSLKIMDYFRASNSKVAKDYLGLNGDLFDYNVEPYDHVNLEIVPEDFEKVTDYTVFLLDKIVSATGKERRKFRNND
jgi:hypothetical protein